jgi:hypothetical protein
MRKDREFNELSGMLIVCVVIACVFYCIFNMLGHWN